jgi:hypothetical protein
MMLPSNLAYANYARAYRTAAYQSFVILDNGMFENDMISKDAILDIANTFQVDEVVMPDARGNMEETLLLIENFLNMFEMLTFEKTPNLMAVIQVDDLAQVPAFLDRIQQLQYYHFDNVMKFTIGIPRRLAEVLAPEARINIVNWLEMKEMSNPVHLLGLNRRMPRDMRDLAYKVRSIDTDAAYVWTAQGEYLVANGTFERPTNYHDLPAMDGHLMKINIATLDRWADGR